MRTIPRFHSNPIETVSVEEIAVSRCLMATALSHIIQGRCSRNVHKPLDVQFLPDEGVYLVMDGHHRLVQLLLRGSLESVLVTKRPTTFRCDVPIEDRFVFTNEPYGGLEALVDDLEQLEIAASRCLAL